MTNIKYTIGVSKTQLIITPVIKVQIIYCTADISPRFLLTAYNCIRGPLTSHDGHTTSQTPHTTPIGIFHQLSITWLLMTWLLSCKHSVITSGNTGQNMMTRALTAQAVRVSFKSQKWLHISIEKAVIYLICSNFNSNSE